MNINIAKDALEYISNKGRVVLIDIKVAGRWVRIEEPVVLLKEPQNINDYTLYNMDDINVYIKKSIKDTDITIKLSRFLIFKTLTVEGLEINKL